MLSKVSRIKPLSVFAPKVAKAFSTQELKFDNMKFEVEKDIAIISLDIPNAKVNTLTQSLMNDFVKVLDHLDKSSGIRGAVLISSKPDGFIAGADINMLAACKSEKELQELSSNGHKIMDRIENSRIPIVAAIHGSCLGGGLEVALACQSRVASSSPKTILGLPEVKLGLLPGAGGTQRLPRLIGAPQALDIILTGKNIKADKAKKMKLVDVVADPTALKSAAMLVAKQLADGTMKKTQPPSGLMNFLLEKNRFGIDFMINQATKSVKEKTGGKYPAPFAILKVIKEGLSKGPAAGYAMEAVEFGKLGMSNESKSLVSIFFADTAAKKNRFGKPKNTYNNLAVIGAGLMGAGIAQVSIEKGMKTVLKDRDHAGLTRGEKQIYGNLNEKVKRRSLTPMQRDITVSRLIGITASDSFGNAHLKNSNMVIEAVFEDLKIKHNVIRELEEIVNENCIIATNTSAIPIADVATASKRPQNIVGMHYFSPVDKMPLLEVITTSQTSHEAKAAAVEVGIKQGKTVIVVNDGPGFYTTRILSPFMVEAGALLQEGYGIRELDKYIKDFGFPVGPVTLFDEVGIDVGNHIQPTLIKAFGERMGGAKTEMMEEMVKQGLCGRKTKAGFFLYNGKKKEVNPKAEEIIKRYQVGTKGSLSVDVIQQRVVLRMVNEAVACLQDQTVSSPQDADVGAIFGLGFPPFLGGPFRYIDYLTPRVVADKLRTLADTFGPRFAPSQLLLDHAKEGKPFYPKN